MATGTVIRFDKKRGYGFVQPDDAGEDVFVHQNNILMEGFRYLNPGERCQYDLEVGDKGMKAVNVTLISERKPEDQFQGGGAGGGDYRGFDERSGGGFGGNGGGYAPRAPRAPRPAAGGDDGSRRKLERLISLLVEKGVLAPGEIDALVAQASEAK